MKKCLRYIVFERPRGSLAWTLAYYPDVMGRGSMPAVCSAKRTALTAAKHIRGSRVAANGQPMRTHIARVELPWTAQDQKILEAWRKDKARMREGR